MGAAVWIVALAAAALLPAWIAARKQPSRRWGTFATYYLFGLLLWIAAVPVAIWVVKDERATARSAGSARTGIPS